MIRNPSLRQVATLRAAVPGVGVFAVLWGVVFARIDFAALTAKTIDEQWQSLGSLFLRSDPIGSLKVLHIQPPGLNALYALDLAVTPDRHLIVGLVLFMSGAGTILLLVDALRRSGLTESWAAGAGVLYALLPATVIYALWGYVVTGVAFLAMAAVWGVAVMRTRPQLGGTASAFAMLGLVLVRPSFVWVLLVVWCAALMAILMRTAKPKVGGLSGIGAALLIGLLAQLHYFLAFGLPTMSSWSGENIAKALLVSHSLVVSPDAREQIDADPCMSQMLAAYEVGQLNRWDDVAFRALPACSVLAPLADKGVSAWDEPMKDGERLGNFNYSDRLVASRKWTEMMAIIVRQDPLQLGRMALTTEYGPTASGLGLYLSPPENYPFVTEIRDALPTATVMGVLSLVFAPVLLVSTLVAWATAIRFPNSPLRRDRAYWFASGLLVFHVLGNVLLEYSENMRYQAEIDPVLLFVGLVGLASILGSKNKEAS